MTIEIHPSALLLFTLIPDANGVVSNNYFIIFSKVLMRSLLSFNSCWLLLLSLRPTFSLPDCLNFSEQKKRVCLVSFYAYSFVKKFKINVRIFLKICNFNTRSFLTSKKVTVILANSKAWYFVVVSPIASSHLLFSSSPGVQKHSFST